MSRERVPYLVWRDARPRWVPGPKLRALGYRGQDLKDEQGRWLSKGAAIEAAEKLNAVAEGQLVPDAPAAPRSMNALFDAYEKSPHFTRRIAKRTRQGYALHIRTLRQVFGHLPVAGLKKPDIAEAHAILEEEHGAAAANAVLRTLKICVNYGIADLHWLTRDPTRGIDMADVSGRLVLWTPEELTAFVAAADALELWSIGDAVTIAALAGQRQGDVLSLTQAAFQDSRFVFRTRKTGRLISVTAVSALKNRIEAARKRKSERWPNVTHTAEIVCELTGTPYLADGSYFRALFRMVRAVAAGANDARERAGELLGKDRAAALGNLLPTLATAPGLAEKRFADLRDTAVTWLFMAGCTVAEIATVTGHSLKTVQEILDKHYFVRDDALSVSAAAKLETFLARR